jgi:hypothetical protein
METLLLFDLSALLFLNIIFAPPSEPVAPRPNSFLRYDSSLPLRELRVALLFLRWKESRRRKTHFSSQTS